MKAMPHTQAYGFAIVIGFIGGAILLSIFATVQMIALRWVISPVGYTTPILFGGVSGAVIAVLYAKLKIRATQEKINHKFLNSILNTIPLFIWSSNVTGAKEKLLFQSHAVEDITGYPSETFKNVNHWLNIVHPDDRSWVSAEVSRQHNGNQSNIKYRIIHANGSVRWVHSIVVPIKDASGAVTQLVGSIEDITAHKQTEVRYRTLFEQSPIALWEEDFSAVKTYIDQLHTNGITDFAAYFDNHPEELEKILGMIKVLDVNHVAVEMFQAADKTDLLTGLRQILSKETFDSFKEELLALIHGETSFSTDTIAYTKTNKPIHVTVCVNVAPDAIETWERIFISTTNITERVLAEKQLATTTESLLKAQAIAHMGNWDWNIITNELTWTDEICRIFGLNPQTFSSTYSAFLDAVHPDDRQLVEDAVNAALTNPDAVYHIQHRVVRPDGSVRLVEEIGDVMRDDTGNPIRMIGTVQDITERHKMETALRQSEERYRNLIDNSPLGVVILQQKQIIYANPTLANILGYTVEELQGKPILNFVHPDYAETAKMRLGRLMQGENALVNAQEEKMVRKDGSNVDVLILGQSVIYEGKPAIQGYIYDITENKQMRQLLKESEERYRKLIEFLPQAVVVHINGKIKYVNPAGLTFIGAETPEEVLDLNLLDFVHPDDREIIASRLQKLIVDKQATPIVEIRIIRLDGNIIYTETSGHPITYMGKDAGLSIITNITERKQLETQLRQSQKMEAIGRLAGGVAHDFNNLLTAIMGYTALLEQQIPTEGAAAHDLHEIKKATNRAADLVRQLLAFSRQQIVQPRLWCLNDSINNIKKMLQRLIGEDIELLTFLPESLGYVKIDPGHVEQIIMNLAINARDAMPSGGKLTVETANVYLNEDYSRRHPEVVPGEYVLLAISDTGIGISPKALEHIFEPFFTTKEVGKGTGLGLATVHGIVKQNKGHIWVHSDVSHGTTFKVYFPRVHTPDESDYARQVAPSKLPSMRGTETILLVEDETAVRELTYKLLTELGYTVLLAANASEALAQIAAANPPPALLLTDVVIKGKMNGRSLADAVQDISPDMRVLYMSGYTDNVIVHHHILDAGLNFIQKPFSPIELARAVRTALDD